MAVSVSAAAPNCIIGSSPLLKRGPFCAFFHHGGAPGLVELLRVIA
jgi:hypothetical protein